MNMLKCKLSIQNISEMVEKDNDQEATTMHTNNKEHENDQGTTI